MQLVSLSHLSDLEFDNSLVAALAREHHSVAWVLTHLVEAESRRRYLPLGYPSLYEYCVQALHLSESVAYKRVAAVQVLRRFPMLTERISDGRLSLTALVLIQPHLTEHTHQELCEAVEHRSMADVRLLIAERFPKRDLPALIRAVVEPATGFVFQAAPEVQDNVTELDSNPRTQSHLVEAAALQGQAQSHAPTDRVTPRSPGRFALQAMLAESAHEDLQALRDLLGHTVPNGELSEVLAHTFKLARQVLETQKYAQTEAPRASRGSDNARCISANVRREVAERDGHRCSFVSSTGHRCTSRRRLEFDHVTPVAKGGASTVENVRLLCRAHNQHVAELALGEKYMRDHRQHAIEQRGRASAKAAQRATPQSPPRF